jgi:uncharacterized membrane protein YkvA (DUF1232 family)
MTNQTTNPTSNLLLNTSEPFGAHPESAWKVSGQAVTVEEFLDDGSRQIAAKDLRSLRALTGQLFEKLEEANSEFHPALGDAIYLIAGVLESRAAMNASDPVPRWLRESAFGAQYLLKGFDLIPDDLPEIGLADDALLLQRIIERNQTELLRHSHDWYGRAASGFGGVRISKVEKPTLLKF